LCWLAFCAPCHPACLPACLCSTSSCCYTPPSFYLPPYYVCRCFERWHCGRLPAGSMALTNGSLALWWGSSLRHFRCLGVVRRDLLSFWVCWAHCAGGRWMNSTVPSLSCKTNAAQTHHAASRLRFYGRMALLSGSCPFLSAAVAAVVDMPASFFVQRHFVIAGAAFARFT